MAQYTKSVTIVLIAMMFTGLAGYFMNTDTEPVIKVTYDYKSNLNPSVMYEAIDDWTEYNPLANVTGWKNTTNVHVPESKDSLGNSIANQYLLSPTIIGYESEQSASFNNFNYLYTSILHSSVLDTSTGLTIAVYPVGTGPYSSTYEGEFLLGLYADRTTYPISTTQANTGPVSVYSSDKPLENAKPLYTYPKKDVAVDKYVLYGGSLTKRDYTPASQNREIAVNIVINAKFVDTASERTYKATGEGGAKQFGVIPLSWYDMSGMKTGAHIHLNTDVWALTEYLDTTYSDPQEVGGKIRGSVVTNINMYFEKSPYRDWVYDSDTKMMYPAEYSLGIWDSIPGSKGHSIDMLCYEFTSISGMDVDLSIPELSSTYPSIHKPVYENAIYADPIYADPTKFVSVDENTIGLWSNSERDGIVEILCSTNTKIKIPNTEITITCPTNTPYNYVLCNLDFLNKEFICRGVTTLSGDYDIVNTQEIKVIDYPYQLGVSTENTPKYIESLNFTSSTGSAKVYIVNTTISVDPLGNLWGNPALYLEYFFPDQLKKDTRVLFNGFVKTGSTLTINGGEPYNIVDNQLIDSNNANKKLPLKGMAVDFIHSDETVKVYIVFTEASDYTIYAGELNTAEIKVPNTASNTKIGYSILGTGTWYWQAGIYDLHEYESTEIVLDIFEGKFGLDMTSACLLMIFFIIVMIAIMQYMDRRYEGELNSVSLTTTDWIILIASMILLLVLASLF